MFATFTDWEFADMDAMVSTGNAMWPKVQAAGALSFKATATGKNTARTMIVWPDAATAHAAIDSLRAAAMTMTDTKATATTAGVLMLDFS